MLSPIDYLLWFASAILEVLVVYCALRTKALRWYLTLTLNMLFAFLINAARLTLFYHYGFRSLEYKYACYSDAVWTMLLYFSILSLYQVAFEEREVSRLLRRGSMLLLGATVVISYLLVRPGDSQLTSRFVVELSQNLYFVGVVLTYMLWGALLKMRETRARLVQLVLALGVYFSASAGSYALCNLYPAPVFARFIPLLAGTFLPAAWAYTFWRVPERARLAPARLALRTR